MPHYVDGTPANLGDLVMKRDSYSGPSLEVVGVVVLIQPASDSCNLQVVPLAVRQKDSGAAWTPIMAGGNPWHVTAKECQRLVMETPVAA